LRKVDEKALIAKAGKGVPLSKKGPAAAKVLPDGGLSELFGLDLGTVESKKGPGKRRPKLGGKKPQAVSRKPQR
jgi:hypothetical protein